jgi:hypothetical protein
MIAAALLILAAGVTVWLSALGFVAFHFAAKYW